MYIIICLHPFEVHYRHISKIKVNVLYNATKLITPKFIRLWKTAMNPYAGYT